MRISDWSSDVCSSDLYGLFSKIDVFALNLGDYTTLKAIKKLPAGVYSANRYLANFPDTKANADWSAAYAKRFKDLPTNWSWQSAAGANFLLEAIRKTNSLDGKKLAEALIDMTIKSPFGVDEKLTLRTRDQTLVHYALRSDERRVGK